MRTSATELTKRMKNRKTRLLITSTSATATLQLLLPTRWLARREPGRWMKESLSDLTSWSMRRKCSLALKLFPSSDSVKKEASIWSALKFVRFSCLIADKLRLLSYSRHLASSLKERTSLSTLRRMCRTRRCLFTKKWTTRRLIYPRPSWTTCLPIWPKRTKMISWAMKNIPKASWC